MLCPNCGQQSEDGTLCCPYCGAPMGQPTPPPPYYHAPVGYAQAPTGPSQDPKTKTASHSTLSTNKVIAIITTVILLIVLAMPFLSRHSITWFYETIYRYTMRSWLVAGTAKWFADTFIGIYLAALAAFIVLQLLDRRKISLVGAIIHALIWVIWFIEPRTVNAGTSMIWVTHSIGFYFFTVGVILEFCAACMKPR